MKNRISSASFILSAVLLLALGSLFLARQSSAQKGGSGGTVVADPFNQFLAIQVANNGRFNMGAFPNNTGGAGANSYDLTYRWPEPPDTSYSTIRIDGANNIYGSSGTVIESPQDIDAKTNRSKWKVGDIEITQILQLVLNPQTGREDLGKISYIVKNVGSVSHSVGQRIMLDTEIAQNDGVPFRVPGVGIVRSEMEFVGSAIPDNFLAFFDVTRSDRVSTSILKSNVEIAPDRLVLAAWRPLYNANFDYTINPSVDFTRDSAYAVYWNARSLAAGESRTYTTYYGLAKLDTDLQPPLALSVDGPAILSVVNNQYSPNPFDVVATVFNNGSATATDVRLTLNLPSDLSLASGSATQAIGNLGVGQERQLSWKVQAPPQSGQTTLSYSVLAAASNAQTKTLSRQINLPALNRFSSVAFFPGFMGSRLYTKGNLVNKEDKLWIANSSADMCDLKLNEDGSSKKEVYTRDIIDVAGGTIGGFVGGGVYRDFINYMNTRQDENRFREWKAFPYDWRLDVRDIVTSGIKVGENGRVTQTLDLVAEIEQLADESYTRKVTIVTHSNGGLLAKALIAELERRNKAHKVDKLIMVAAPQLGTPESIARLLQGHNVTPPWIAPNAFREAGETMRGAYNFIPYSEYFNRITEPVIEFDSSTKVKQITSNLNSSISSYSDMRTFLLGESGSVIRSEPVTGACTEVVNYEALSRPNILRQTPLRESEDYHTTFDNWVPPAGLEVIQVAGWGEQTLRGIKYTTKRLCGGGFFTSLDK